MNLIVRNVANILKSFLALAARKLSAPNVALLAPVN